MKGGEGTTILGKASDIQEEQTNRIKMAQSTATTQLISGRAGLGTIPYRGTKNTVGGTRRRPKKRREEGREPNKTEGWMKKRVGGEGMTPRNGNTRGQERESPLKTEARKDQPGRGEATSIRGGLKIYLV